jgi:RNA polymerase sigma factor (sigma-70 family)
LQQLACLCQRLTQLLAPRYGFTCEERADLGAEFFLFLVGEGAIRLQRCPKDAAVERWLAWRLRGFLSHAARTRGRRARCESCFSQAAEDIQSAEAVVCERLCALLRRTILDEAMAALTEQDQEIIRLAVVDELPHVQVARVLGITPSTSRKRLQRALTRLRQRLEQEPCHMEELTGL